MFYLISSIIGIQSEYVRHFMLNNIPGDLVDVQLVVCYALLQLIPPFPYGYLPESPFRILFRGLLLIFHPLLPDLVFCFKSAEIIVSLLPYLFGGLFVFPPQPFLDLFYAFVCELMPSVHSSPSLGGRLIFCMSSASLSLIMSSARSPSPNAVRILRVT